MQYLLSLNDERGEESISMAILALRPSLLTLLLLYVPSSMITSTRKAKERCRRLRSCELYLNLKLLTRIKCNLYDGDDASGWPRATCDEGRRGEPMVERPTRDTPQKFGFWNFRVWGRNIVRIFIAIPSSEIPFFRPETISGFGNDLGMTSG
jgi:hypothetical protein